MKKKLLLFTFIVMALVCVFAISASAESAYVNADGVQVSADSSDIAYEIEIHEPWQTGGNCRLTYIYLYDTSITKLVIPAIELTHSNGSVYKMAEYNYVRLATGWGTTLPVYAVDDRDTKANSLHTQIKELEFHVPVLCDGAGSQGNLAGWSGLEKLSFFSKAYETQSKGGSLSGCTSLKELHFYGENNELSANFFPSSMVAGSKIVFHENATGTIRSTAMQGLNGKDITVYLNNLMTPKNPDDPRLTWNKNSNGLLKFVLLVDDKSGYSAEEIASYESIWQAGNNANVNNSTYSMPIQTYCEFYGEHPEIGAIENNTCQGACVRCNEIQVLPDAVHTNVFTQTFAGTRFFSSVNLSSVCENCATVEFNETLSAPFNWVGYSAKTFGDAKGFGQQYVINQSALTRYIEIMTSRGVTVTYGVVAAGTSSAGQPLEIVDGVVTDKAGAESICFNQIKYDAFFMNITGIDNANLDANLVCCAYVQLGEEIVYLDDNQAKDTAGFLTYNIVAGLPETKGDEE